MLVPFIYVFAKGINFIYLAQILYGVGSGLAYPTWLGIWSTHLDRKHESFEWSLYSTLTGLGTAATATVGAVLAQFFGFEVTFIIVGILALVGCFILFGLERLEVKSNKIHHTHYHQKRKLIHKKYN